MLDRLGEKGVKAHRRMLFPNWTDTREIFPLDAPGTVREELGISPGSVVALYSGSMGEKHGLESLVQAARLLAGRGDVLFLLCGQGIAHQRLRALSRGLANIRWLPLQPSERLNALLNAADIHVLPQRPQVADLVMPSKLGGMLASGRPVIAAALPDTQIQKVVSECGLVVPPEDPQALASAIERLADDRKLRYILGACARRYAVQYLDKNLVLSRFEQALRAA
jgi:colanic acid biosynthesis glycosyl transferase WcaI